MCLTHQSASCYRKAMQNYDKKIDAPNSGTSFLYSFCFPFLGFYFAFTMEVNAFDSYAQRSQNPQL